MELMATNKDSNAFLKSVAHTMGRDELTHDELAQAMRNEKEVNELAATLKDPELLKKIPCPKTGTISRVSWKLAMQGAINARQH